jgi:hypothetical protein
MGAAQRNPSLLGRKKIARANESACPNAGERTIKHQVRKIPGATLSHPIPLHPDADLAVVLDDMRQSVAAWGDEGMVMRFFRASICLMLLSILDTLIELLADFRAGRLPPVLPALDESFAIPAANGPPRQRTAARRGQRPASPRTPRAMPAEASESSAVAPCRTEFTVVPLCLAEHGPRGVAGHPSAVPRAPGEKFGAWGSLSTHVHIVAYS